MQDSPLQRNYTVNKQGGAQLAQGLWRMFKEAPDPSVLDDKSHQRNGRPILIFDMGPPHNHKVQSTLCIWMQFLWPKQGMDPEQGTLKVFPLG